MSFDLKQLILDRFSVQELAEILDLNMEEFYDRFEDLIMANLEKLQEIDNGLQAKNLPEETEE